MSDNETIPYYNIIFQILSESDKLNYWALELDIKLNINILCFDESCDHSVWKDVKYDLCMSWKCWCLLFLCYVEGSMKFHDILGGQIKYWPVSTKEVHEESVKARNWEFCLSLMSSEFISPLKSTERHFKCVITVITAGEWSLTLWG